MLDVARRLTHRSDILFVLAGEGAARPRLEAAAKGLANLRFLPLQPASKFNHLLTWPTCTCCPSGPMPPTR